MAFDRELYEKEKRNYLEINKDLFVQTNPHPKQLRVGDCVKRALVIATGMDYNELKIKINQHKRKLQERKRKRPITAFNDDRNWIPFMEKEFNVEKLSGYHNMKIGEFAKLNLPGKYVIRLRGHAVAVIDGKVLDTWNCSFNAIGRIWRVS